MVLDEKSVDHKSLQDSSSEDLQHCVLVLQPSGWPTDSLNVPLDCWRTLSFHPLIRCSFYFLTLQAPGFIPFPPSLFSDAHLLHPSPSIAAVGKSLEDGAPSVMIFCSAEQWKVHMHSLRLAFPNWSSLTLLLTHSLSLSLSVNPIINPSMHLIKDLKPR